MSISDQQFSSWLKDQSASRCILIEVDVKTGGVEVTRYLSSRGYVTGDSETPANTSYVSRIVGGIKFTRSLDLDGGVSLSYGDIELTNADGGIDSWLDDFWSNRSIRFYLGDTSWARADFRLVFSGVTTGVDSRKRDRINIKLSDKLQRLNTPVSELKLGGTSSLSDSLRPIVLGEVHNIEPLLVDSSVNEYEVHSSGAIESIIEVRDNGVPVSITPLTTTGRFRLSNQPAGTITASAQGYKSAVLVNGSNQFADDAYWSATRVTRTVVPDTAPFTGKSSTALIATTANNTRWLQQMITVDPTKTYAASVFVKLGLSGRVDLQIVDTINAAYQGVSVNTVTGVNSKVTLNPDSSAYTTTWGAVQVTSDGWYRIWWAGSVNNFSTSLAFRIRVYGPAAEGSYAGDGVSTYVSVYGAQFEQASMPSAFSATAATDNGIYKNTVAELIRLLVTSYGKESNRFTESEIDLNTFVYYDVNYPAPVGVYVKDRENVLDVCNSLATSIGARLVVDYLGRLTLARLSLPATVTGTLIGPGDMVERSLEVSSLTDVTASVKLGYCKNWTVQDSLTTGILKEHAALYAEEWLTFTQTDSAAAANYNLYTDPDMEESYLLTVSDAASEALRRLNMLSTQRKTFKYSGYYHLILENLGGYQTITHPRFGLSTGKTGQIMSITVDWLSPHVDFEVLI